MLITTVHHDHIAGYIANQHVDHTAVSIVGDGLLSGGGTIAANRTISLANGDIDHDSLDNYVSGEHVLVGALDHNSLLNYVANKHIDWTNAASKTIKISGTGNFFGLDLSDITVSTSLTSILRLNNFCLASGTPQYTGFNKQTDGNVRLSLVTDVAKVVFNTAVHNDPGGRFLLNSAGAMNWGSGAGGTDTNLYRLSSNNLKTDATFTAANFITVGSMSAGLFGTTLKVSSNSIGFFAGVPTAKQTGVPITSAGIHAALVAYGLIS